MFKGIGVRLGFGIALVASGAAFAGEMCAEDLAQTLLKAILAKDVAAIQQIGGNSKVLDEEGLDFLVGSEPFPTSSGLRSARQVLGHGRVLTKVSISEMEDGSRLVDIVYLPSGGVDGFAGLAKKIESGQALLFRDYVMCQVVLEGGRTFLPNACYAETDVH